MIKQQIKQELRRSAFEDEDYSSLKMLALYYFIEFSDWPRIGINELQDEDIRTFMLLVAEAL